MPKTFNAAVSAEAKGGGLNGGGSSMVRPTSWSWERRRK